MKHHLRALFLTLFFVFFNAVVPMSVSAQSVNLKKANAFFEEGDYLRAIQEYKDILKKSNDIEAKKRLADSYRLLKQPDAAELWYAQVVSQPGVEPIYKYYYGIMLKANGKYDEAKTVFIEYSKLAPHDSRGLKQIEACEKSGFFFGRRRYLQNIVGQYQFKKSRFCSQFL